MYAMQVKRTNWVAERDCDGWTRTEKVWRVEIVDESGEHVCYSELIHPTKASAEGEIERVNEMLRTLNDNSHPDDFENW